MRGETNSLVMFLPQGDWEVNTRQRMILALADEVSARWPRAKLLCVERPICLSASPLLARDKFTKWVMGRKSLRRVLPNLHVLTPWVLFPDRLILETPLLPQLNNVVQGYQVRRALQRIGAEEHSLIVWVFHPYQRHYCQMLPKDLLVFEISDEFHEFANVRDNQRLVRLIRANEELILKQADLVFATAANLSKRLVAQHSNVYFVPNGADVEHFAAVGEDCSLPPGLEGIPRPMIGFVGKINEQIDYPLINHLALKHPDWSIVLLGNFDGESSLKADQHFIQAMSLPNMFFLGWKDYAQLPRYVHAFDVCLIPFVINPLTVSIYPLKLHEYLAAGKPVVSTDLPELKPFSELVRIASDPDGFERQVIDSLAERNGDLPRRRLAVARQNSWKKRAEAMVEIMQNSRRH